jgi:hypothetical protein
MNNKYDKRLNPNDYMPKRFGLKFNPPQMILEYMVPSVGKLYHHKIKLPKLKHESNTQEVIKEIYEKHYAYLDHSKINLTQVISKYIVLTIGLVEKLRTSLPPSKSENRHIDLKITENHKYEEHKGHNYQNDEEDEDYYKYYDYHNENLNELQTEELNRRKNEMDKLYQKNAVLPGSGEFVYDIRVHYY